MITPELLSRNPLITEKAAAFLQKMLADPDAPHWNYSCGDRVTKEDLEEIEAFKRTLYQKRRPWLRDTPPVWLLQRLSLLLPKVPLFRERFSHQVDLEADWQRLPTTSREDLSTRLLELIPEDEDVAKMVTHATSGTTGHPIIIPHHPVAGSCYLPLLDFVLERYGISLSLHEEMVGCILVCAQQKTITYATAHAAWQNSGFAKINLAASDWPTPKSLYRYCEKFSPAVVSGDPISFAEMMRLQVPFRPRAMITTAVAMSEGIRIALEKAYGCPVIDWYSLNETGPIAYRCREGFFHLLPHDIFVELLDPEKKTAPPNARGQITVSGGRNPYLPMWRYQTGDFARLEREKCACGDEMPRLLDLEGRAPVLLYASDGRIVNTVDVSRVLRALPIIQHQLVQRADYSIEIRVRALQREGIEAKLTEGLQSLFGALTIQVYFDTTLGEETSGGKVLPYRSEVVPM